MEKKTFDEIFGEDNFDIFDYITEKFIKWKDRALKEKPKPKIKPLPKIPVNVCDIERELEKKNVANQEFKSVY